ncbi:unnamed protein product [Paramecium octaurelia]|uniref:Sel1 repeat family protein n=1 Tax=Paramecium octaurelia TaxID=43137 RepID=A0A8S1Y4F8_PAROT|nr:unnamed protein product [Paramecium octaurelia]
MSLLFLLQLFSLYNCIRFSQTYSYFDSIDKLDQITDILQRGNPCNLEALNACALKLYMLNNDVYAISNLGYFHLFGFPENRGDEHLHFCQEFGGFSVPLLKQNESLAYNYFKLSNRQEVQVYIAFMDWMNFKRGGPVPRSIRKLKNLDYTLAKLAYFNYQYNCHRFRNIPELELSQRFDEMFGEADCQQCDQLMLIGYQIGEAELQYFHEVIPKIELTHEDFLLIEQQANNGDPQAQLQLAYQFYAGNEELGINRDVNQAMNIFSNMTLSGESLHNQALLHVMKGEYQQAQILLQQAIELFQMPDSYNLLGYMYLQGLGVEEDFRMAQSLFQQAVDRGFDGAAVTLGIMKMNRNVTEGVELLLNHTEYNARWALIQAYVSFQKVLDNQFGCQRFLNVTREFIKQIMYPIMQNEKPLPEDPKSQYIMKQFWAFLGIIEPIDLEEQVIYRVEGAATALAHDLTDEELKKKFYQSDLQPESYISLSQIEFAQGNATQAQYWVDQLIRQCIEGKYEMDALFVAYTWKAWITLVNIFY